ncbi:MAG: hypothetical protein DWQ34_19230 [Planctomycetota bacterium]|nr:MAG: hypothetical protein DWQ29_11995 [Planctomycetota bacterium]REJ89654.1 MAG: hypothetical protein DWQ34_19230 [Planctomycetota bacterium]REK24365.1 MAG: hypothetical protein DWQ41_15200 [Planctomycetota bacterium]REK38556.1 MAG: hypothetical protein DWQ45_03995 [Planctomycetota bacterium]
MNQLTLSDIGESAGLIAIHASHISSAAVPPDNARLLECVTLSRRTLRLWMSAVDEYGDDPAAAERLIRLSSEVLVVEVLNRVSAAVFAVSDARRHVQQATPFARQAHLNHLHARHAVLSMLVDHALPLGATLRLNQLRRKTERWSDFLLSSLKPFDVASEFAVDKPRCAEFRSTTAPVWNSGVRDLTLAALRNAIPNEPIDCDRRELLHADMLRLMFSFLPPTACHADGRPHSRQLNQLFDPTLLGDRSTWSEIAATARQSSRLRNDAPASAAMISRHSRSDERPHGQNS